MRSVFSGILISLGALGYLALGGIPGAIIFSFGLVCVVILGTPLYTGAAGNIDLLPKFVRIGIKELAGIFFGNVLGCFLVSLIPQEAGTLTAAQGIIESRLSLGILEALWKSILCGLIIDVIVFIYRRGEKMGNPHSILPLLFGVPLFIILGGIHSVADSFYILYAKVWRWKLLLYYPTIVLGNFIGCNLRRIFLKGL